MLDQWVQDKAVQVTALGPSGRIDKLEPERMLEGKRGDV